MSEQNLNNNQINQSDLSMADHGWGGKREGAGRRRGSTSRPQILDYITPDDVSELMRLAKEQAGHHNSAIIKYLLDHIFGKPPQTTNFITNQQSPPVALIEFIDEEKRESPI